MRGRGNKNYPFFRTSQLELLEFCLAYREGLISCFEGGLGVLGGGAADANIFLIELAYQSASSSSLWELAEWGDGNLAR